LIFRFSLVIFCINPAENIDSPKLMKIVSNNLLLYSIYLFWLFIKERLTVHGILYLPSTKDGKCRCNGVLRLPVRLPAAQIVAELEIMHKGGWLKNFKIRELSVSYLFRFLSQGLARFILVFDDFTICSLFFTY
jgi:hypothetical protein